jgi:TRAP-type C4-dicarboxylate transport system substrate-binding protein
MAMVAGPAQGRDFRWSDINPPGTPTVEAMERLGELFRERTQGRHRLVTLGAGDLDSENFIVGQVQTGKIDIARVNATTFNSAVPETAPLTLPFLFKSREHLRRVIDGPIGADILKSLEAHGVIGLCFYDTGPRSLYTVDRPVRNLADIKGLRIRVQLGDLSAQIVPALGAAQVTIPFSRVGLALKSRAIDGADGNWTAYAANGHYHYAKIFNETMHSRPPGVVIVSREAWSDLSDDDRAVLRQATLESLKFLRQRVDAYEEHARFLAAQEGVQVIQDIDRKSFSDVLLPSYDRLLTNQRQRELLTRIQAAELASTP